MAGILFMRKITLEYIKEQGDNLAAYIYEPDKKPEQLVRTYATEGELFVAIALSSKLKVNILSMELNKNANKSWQVDPELTGANVKKYISVEADIYVFYRQGRCDLCYG